MEANDSDIMETPAPLSRTALALAFLPPWWRETTMVLGNEGLACGMDESTSVVEAAMDLESTDVSSGLSLCSSEWCFR